jgi:hypothetical protein
MDGLAEGWFKLFTYYPLFCLPTEMNLCPGDKKGAAKKAIAAA